MLALGLACGFLEPLESTSIYLVQTCLTRFLAMMPKRDIDDATVDVYNQIILAEYVNIKDFLIAHYNAHRAGRHAVLEILQTHVYPR